MISFERYFIDKVNYNDAEGISALMLTNRDRFIRFFPLTLEENLNLESSKVFALQKSNKFENRDEFLFTLKLKDCSQIIGLIYIKELDWDKKQGEFAYCIDANFASKGIMQKAIKHLIIHAFSILQLQVLQIIVHQSNKASIKIAKNCGFSWCETLMKQHTPPNEEALDMELYELRKNER